MNFTSGVTLTQAVKQYGDLQVIHGFDLEIEHGESCVFVGPSGCGKSTLLRMIARFSCPISSSLLIVEMFSLLLKGHPGRKPEPDLHLRQ